LAPDTHDYKTEKYPIKKWHQKCMNYDKSLVCDHINRKKFDNRTDNLRIVPQNQNDRNKSTRPDNSSGKQGVNRCFRQARPYWRVQITNNEKKRISKYFPVNVLGEEEAKRQAIAKRKELEEEFGYLGE
jgi:hypothetical protein